MILSLQALPARGEVAFGVGLFQEQMYDGVFAVDTDASTAKMIIATPGVAWFGATDGSSSDYFYGVANPYDPAGSGLYTISVADWSVSHVGNINWDGSGIGVKEIALYEPTGTLYGTDYTNLYSIDPLSCTATCIGAHGAAIDAVWALDYDPVVGQLVGANRQLNPAESPMYYFDRGTGAATLVGTTGTYNISDIWYDPDSGTTYAAGNGPGRLFTLNTFTGLATQIGEIPNVNLLGTANATPSGPLPDPIMPQVPVPVLLTEYSTYASADAYASIRDMGGGEEDGDEVWDSDYNEGCNGPVEAHAYALAEYEGAWQESEVDAQIDVTQLGDAVEAYASAEIRAACDYGDNWDLCSWWDGSGDAGVTEGYIQIGTAKDVPPGQPGILYVSLASDMWGDMMEMGTSLRIWEEGNPFEPLLDEWYEWWEPERNWELDVVTGQALVFSMSSGGWAMGDCWFDGGLETTLNFHATGEIVPEPTTLSMTLIGGLAALLGWARFRRRAPNGAGLLPKT